MKRKAFIVLFGAVLLLMATALTEYLFYRQDENTWVERFESRLHEQERKADHLLATFRDSVDIDSEEWEEDLIFVGIREGRVFFWTNEIIGDRHLSELLTSGRNFTKIGNTYYEIRRKRYKDIDYYALLRIKDDYPYTGKYIKNNFGKFLNISEENIGQVEISTVTVEQGHLITDKDGMGLFFIVYGDHYKERASNYLLLSFYLLFFLLQLPAFLHQLLKVPVCPLIPDSPGRQKPCPLRCFCFFVRQHIPFLQKLRFFHTRKLFCRHSELLEDRPRL